MKTDFSTAPFASGLRGADGGTVEKSQRAPYTKKLTLPDAVQPAFVDFYRIAPTRLGNIEFFVRPSHKAMHRIVNPGPSHPGGKSNAEFGDMHRQFKIDRALPQTVQDGRASCRERVCKYV